MMFVKFPLYTKYMFFKSPGKKGDTYKFSSDLEKIGYEWDVSIQNETSVDLISEPIEIDHPLYGAIKVVKIKADIATDYHTIIKEFWVPVDSVVNVTQEKHDVFH